MLLVPFVAALSFARLSLGSLLQLLEKIIQVKELFLGLNLPILVELEEADTFQEEDSSRLGRKAYSPFDGRFLTTHPDVERVEFELIEDCGERF